MAFDIYDSITLIEVLNAQPDPPNTYWLDLCFGGTGAGPQLQLSEGEAILFDTLPYERRLAPFVAPNVQGRMQAEAGYTTKMFKPAYVKPKHSVNPARAIPRQAGEPLMGAYSLEQRFNSIVAKNAGNQRFSIVRLWEWMAAQAIMGGQIVIQSQDYPSSTVAFGRSSELTVTLTGTAVWDHVLAGSTADPLSDIADMRQQMRIVGRATADRMTFGIDAWNAFIKVPSVYEVLSKFYSGSNNDFNRGPNNGAAIEYKGVLTGGPADTGGLEMWVYNEWYEDELDDYQPFMDGGSVVFSGGMIRGYRCFGAIQDIRAGLAVYDMWPKMWVNEDPSVLYQMTQSAPLMVPAWPNGSGIIKVATSEADSDSI